MDTLSEQILTYKGAIAMISAHYALSVDRNTEDTDRWIVTIKRPLNNHSFPFEIEEVYVFNFSHKKMVEQIKKHRRLPYAIHEDNLVKARLVKFIFIWLQTNGKI